MFSNKNGKLEIISFWQIILSSNDDGDVSDVLNFEYKLVLAGTHFTFKVDTFTSGRAFGLVGLVFGLFLILYQFDLVELLNLN